MLFAIGKTLRLITCDDEQKDEPNTIADFLSRWKMEVGDDFNSTANLDSLKVRTYVGVRFRRTV